MISTDTPTARVPAPPALRIFSPDARAMAAGLGRMQGRRIRSSAEAAVAPKALLQPPWLAFSCSQRAVGGGGFKRPPRKRHGPGGASHRGAKNNADLMRIDIPL